MYTTELETLVAKFSTTADAVKSNLSNMLKTVTEERVPSQNQINELKNSVESLQEKYDCIYVMTKAIVSGKELPDEGCSVSKCVTAINDNKIQLKKMHLANVKILINQFVIVKSSVDTYAQALECFQKEAIGMLEQLENINDDIPQVINQASTTHRMFLQALKIEDIGSSEGIALLDKLDDFFPSKVQRGLALKKYYFPDNNNHNDENKNDDLVEAESTTESCQNTIDTSTFATTAEKVELIYTPSVSVINDVTCIEKNNVVPAETIIESISISEQLQSVNKIKNTSSSAAKMQNDIKKFPRKAFIILPLLTNLGVLTAEQIFYFGLCLDYFKGTDEDNEKEKILETLNILSAMNYLAAYNIKDTNQYVFCLTDFGYGSMHKKTIAVDMQKLWAISYGKYKFVGNSIIEKEAVVLAIHNNDILLKYFYGIKKHLSSEDYNIIKDSIKWDSTHYVISVIYNNKTYICFLTDITDNIESMKTENILIVSDEMIYEPILLDNNVSNCFLYCKDSLYIWNENQATLITYRQVESTGELQTENKENIIDLEITVNDEAISVIDCLNKSETIKLQSTEKVADEKNNDREEIISDNKQPVIEPSAKSEKLSENTIDNEDSSIISIGLRMINAKDIPTDEMFYNIILSILNDNLNISDNSDNYITQALLLAKAVSLESGYIHCQELYKQLLLATNLQIDDCNYSSESLASVFPNFNSINESLMLSSYLYAMLVPDKAYDYALKEQTEQLIYDFDLYFPNLSNFKSLFIKLNSIHEVISTGFTNSILGLLGNEAENEKYFNDLQNQAKALLTIPSIKTRMNALPKLYNACFGPNSDLYYCINVIANNNKEERTFVADIFAEYCDIQKRTYKQNMSKIEDILDNEWSKVNSGNRMSLGYEARDQALRHFRNRLNLIQTWVELEDNNIFAKSDILRLKTLKIELLKLIQDSIESIHSTKSDYRSVVLWMLKQMKAHLSGQERFSIAFPDLLYSGIISLDDKGMPIIDKSLCNVKYYEPWRNVIKHIVSPRNNIDFVKSEIYNCNSDMFDNLHQMEMIGKHLGSELVEYSISKQQLTDAIIYAETKTNEFKEKLELAYTYNRISENEKESISAILAKYELEFFTRKDFGCWRQLLHALGKQIDDITAERGQRLIADLAARKATLSEGQSSLLLDEAETILTCDKNYAVTEEYINRFDTGEKEFTDELQAVFHDADNFADFLYDSTFNPLYKECHRCTGRTLKSFGWDFISNKLPVDWTVRLREDSQKLVFNWPTSKDFSNESQVKNLFSCFGFNVSRARKVPGRKEELYLLDTMSVARNMIDYRHPIAAFGTQLKPILPVVIFYGNYTAKQLVDTIMSMNLGGIVVVLIDRPLERTVRRQVSEIFHTQTSGQNPFILIDQVLALHLAMHQITERLPILLKCTLPYTLYQPFIRDGGSTADEMFCGRVRELATIIDPNGACIVYGGRQLGKTALLERAQSRCSKPENLAFAVYSNIINCKKEDELVATIINDFSKKTPLLFKPCVTIIELCNQIDQMFRNKKIVSMLLLLDEADNYLGEISSTRYISLQPLIDLKRETKNNFKFVLAGLHNVCRAKKATEENGVFGQLGTPLCVKPLSPTDALQLLSKPLRYLGFQIESNQRLRTILTNTNYYPGILQFFGYTLVQTLTSQYSKYYRAIDGNPPFALQDEQLGSVMASADLNRSIKDKFRWSLELDPRYFMLARCIAMLYYFNDEESSGSHLGFTVEGIISMADSYKINCLKDETKTDYINLLDEMVDMGILTRPQTGSYRLRKHSFINIISTDLNTLEVDIIDNNKREA